MQTRALLEIIADQKKKLPIKDIVPRECLTISVLKKPSKFIQIFSGVRRCGKSTVIEILRKRQKEQDYYLNFDDERVIEFKVEDFQKLYELFIEKFGEQKTFYFDEIQNIKGWERFVRRLYDEGNKIYLTGSNAELLSKELGTHLTGRYVQTELYPFSFREYLILKGCPLGTRELDLLSTKERVQIKKHFEDYRKKGGFPEFLLTGNAEYLKQLYENIIYRDIVVRYQLPHEKMLKELGHYFASNIGKPISFNQLKKMLGAGSATTIKEYLNYFENSYLFFAVNKFDHSLKKQIYAPKKVYSIDNRLAAEIGFRFNQDRGRYLENLVFLDLKRKNKAIFYHQGQKECDFLIKEGPRITQAIQVCADIENPMTKERELKGLMEAMEIHKLSTGLILTEDQEAEEKIALNGKGKKIRILPLWKWLLFDFN